MEWPVRWRLRCVVGLHRWEAVTLPESTMPYLRCRLCSSWRWP